MKPKFDSCESAATCTKCDIGYIIRKYVKPLMQTLTNDIKHYYMRLLTTKCLNTAVMLGTFMLGKRRLLKIADYCDTEATRERHTTGQDNNQTIIDNLKGDLLKKSKTRWLYYILLTDGKFPNADKAEKFFPGHVFILEKIPTQSKPIYYFYQSYINEYDLDSHIKQNNRSLMISYDRAVQIVDDLKYILNAQTWDLESVARWKRITFIDTSDLLSFNSYNNFFVCYKKAQLRDCLKHIKEYTSTKLQIIKRDLPQKQNQVYGESSLYDKNEKPLTYQQMYNKLNNLMNELKSRT